MSSLSSADSPASPSPSPESGLGNKTKDGSGLSFYGSFAWYDPATSSWKTSQVSLLKEWDEFSETWPLAGSMRNGIVFPQPMLERPTSDDDSSSWPTPTAVSRPNEGNVRMLRKKVLAGELSEEEATAMLGKSPFEAQGKVPKYPTPTASDWKGPNLSSKDSASGHMLAAKVGGYLNPTWVEWLQGFPLRWTDLEV